MSAILNTTFIIDKSVEKEVIDWIRNSYAKSAAKLLVAEPLLMMVMAHVDDGVNIALQLQFDSIADAQKWDEGVAASLRRIMSERWGEKTLSFSTYLLPIE